MISLTGRSSAKRAKRYAAQLRQRQEARNRLRLAGQNRLSVSAGRAATTAYGLPGMESSGVQAIRSSLVASSVYASEEEQFETDLAQEIRYNTNRAKSKARTFSTVAKLASAYTGFTMAGSGGIADIVFGDTAGIAGAIKGVQAANLVQGIFSGEVTPTDDVLDYIDTSGRQISSIVTDNIVRRTSTDLEGRFQGSGVSPNQTGGSDIQAQLAASGAYG